MKQYADDANILIADVDCTAGGKELCSTVGVQGYPTIKYGDPNNLEDYEGGRDLKSLKKFAKENLGPSCGPNNLDLCDDDKKALVQKFLAMSASELEESIAGKEQEMKAADKEMEDLLKSLNEQYTEAQKKTDDKKKEIKESGLGLMKSVRANQKLAKGEL